MKTAIASITALAASFALTVSATADNHKGAKDIVDIAAGDKNFSTLVAAVKAAGLVDTLGAGLGEEAGCVTIDREGGFGLLLGLVHLHGIVRLAFVIGLLLGGLFLVA